MFNRTIINQGGGTHHHSITKTVHEHRAPTDQSIALLNEMQEKTLENILNNYTVWNNSFLYNVHKLIENGTEKIRLVYCINGKKYNFDILPHMLYIGSKLPEAVHKALSKQISNHLSDTMLQWLDIEDARSFSGSWSGGLQDKLSFQTANEGVSSEELEDEFFKEKIKARLNCDIKFRNFLEDLVE